MGAKRRGARLGPIMQLFFAGHGTVHATDIYTHYTPVGLTGRRGDAMQVQPALSRLVFTGRLYKWRNAEVTC